MERFSKSPGSAHTGILLSIHFTSNRPGEFSRFLDRLETSTSDMSAVEVVVKIDNNDEVMNALLEKETRKRPFRVTYISTAPPDGFYGLWKSYDDLLKAADPNAYFVVGLNDEMYFETHHWDLVLRRYVGLFPDHIFRLRTSKQRTRNYFDAWEAGFANDTSAIMTKRWLDIGGGWCPCNGPDSFQQSVAYYFGWLHRFRADRITRELPIYDLNLGGHGANLGDSLKGRALRRRIGGSIRPWFVLMSHKMQEEAARRAQKLHAHIWGHQNAPEEYEVRDERLRRRIAVVRRGGDVIQTFDYRLSLIRIGLTNIYRTLRGFAHYGYGGERPPWGSLKDLSVHLCYRYEYLGRLLDILWFEPNQPPSFRRSVVLLLLSGPSKIMNSCKRVWRQML